MQYTRRLLAATACAIGLMMLFSGSAEAQIFKKSAPDTAAPPPAEPKKAAAPKKQPKKKVAPKKAAPAPKAKAKAKPVEKKAPPAAAAQSKPKETVKPSAAEEQEAPATDSVADDCASLEECVAAIQPTLGNMKTAEELARLNALTQKAESLLAAEGGAPPEAAAAEGAQTAPTETAVASAKTVESKAEGPVQEASGDGTMTANEEAALLERVARLEESLAAVGAKTEENEKRITAKESPKGFKIFGPGDSVFTIAGLLQTRMETAKDGAPNGENWSYGLYIRRMRLMFYGQVTKWLNFFIETEQAKFGLNGDWSGKMFIQDAYVELNPHPAIQVDVGMMLPSLSRHANQSATSLIGMDYHGTLVKYPAGSTMVWRDMGVMVRGLVLNKKLDYRLAIWSGVHGSASDPRNPKDLPRLTGRLTSNVFDAEGGGGVGGMFFDGVYLKKDGNQVVSTKRVLSFGVSYDWQPDLNVELEAGDPDADPPVADMPVAYSDYVAVAGDVFWNLPFGENKIMSADGQMNFYYFNHGDRRADEGYWYYNAAGNALNYTGWGMFGEFGIRYSKIEPLFMMDIYDSTKADDNAGDYLNFAGGLNYYFLASATTFKLQAGADKAGDGDWKPAVKFQLQFVF